MRDALLAWLDDTRVVVCLGHGGVGKTTSAAALAVAAAMLGRRVAVLTVDPAARLRDALELPKEPGALHRIALPPGSSGTLDALLLDAKGLFDDLIRRFAPAPALAESILANPVYRNVAGALAGSDAYMALEQVLDLAQSGEHDLIVVDTPPASHALDLFDAPERILALLESKALEYLEEPTRILGAATSRLARGVLTGILTALERMTGLHLLRDISSLASDFSGIAPRFRARAREIRRLLHAESTRHVLVCTTEPHSASDAVAFAAEANQHGVRADAVIVNRVLALGLQTPSAAAGSGIGRAVEDTTAAPPAWPVGLSRTLVHCARDLKTVIEAQEAVGRRLREDLTALRGRATTREGLLWLELPALSPAPVDREGIIRLAGFLMRGADRSISAA